MAKKIRCSIFLLVICITLSVPSFAKDGQIDKDYRVYFEAYAGNVDWKAWSEQKELKVGWGSFLCFALAERDSDSDETADGLGNLKDGERPVKGVSWEAVLQDGTVIEPFDIYEAVSPPHEFDEENERKKWEQEYAEFEIPLEYTGTMIVKASLGGKVVAEFDITVTEKDSRGKLIRGWLFSRSKRYYVQNDGTLARGWMKRSGQWYYLNEDGVLQTGWQHLSYDGKTDWYYLSEKRNHLGRMLRGWVKLGDTWYYLRKDGTLASNEWYRGYWVSADGSWKYKPKGSWKHDKNGWWFGDTSGWYAKNEEMKINGVLYSFDAHGYLVE